MRLKSRRAFFRNRSAALKFSSDLTNEWSFDPGFDTRHH
jgi:hypothetical protein